MADSVDHPPHYNQHPSGVECIQVVEHLGFNVGNAVKYVWRAGMKGDKTEDLRKAEWYLQRELERFHVFDESGDGLSTYDGEEWKPLLRRVIFREPEGSFFGSFLRELLRLSPVRQEAVRSVSVLLGFVEKELKEIA